MNLDDYEGGKGLPRSSSEYLVPKAVREKLLKEHACVSRRDMAVTVRAIQKEKAKRRKTVTNLNLSGAEEVLENVRRSIKTILKPSSTYQIREAKLWDEAHAVAMEKAKRLEESIHRGESVRPLDFYKVGTICNSSSSNHGGGRRHTVPVGGSGSSMASVELNRDENLGDGGDNDIGPNAPRRNTAPTLGKDTSIDVHHHDGGNAGSAEIGSYDDGGRCENPSLSITTTVTTSPSRSSIGTAATSSALDQQGENHQQQEELFDNNVFVTATTTASTTGGGLRRGSHASIVAMESDGEDDVLAQLNLDNMNVSSVSKVE